MLARGKSEGNDAERRRRRRRQEAIKLGQLLETGRIPREKRKKIEIRFTNEISFHEDSVLCMHIIYRVYRV